MGVFIVTRLNPEENPFYCPAIIRALRDHKIALWPIWAAALPRASGLKTFLRASNATVESNFNIRKNVFMKSKRLAYNKYAREAFNYHDASLKEAVGKVLASSKNPNKSSGNKKQDDASQPEEADEVWSKRRSTQRQSSYLTPIPTIHLSPSQASLSKTKRRYENATSSTKINDSAATTQLDSEKDEQNVKRFDEVLELPRTAKVYSGKFKFLTTPRGIPNVGLSCYINSPLQCLLTLPGILKQPIASCLFPYLDILYRENLDVTQIYQNARKARTETNVCLILQKEEEERLVASKTGRKPVAGRPNLSPNQQEDAHDYLTRLLDLWDLKEIKYLFGFKMCKTLKCGNCKQERELTPEKYYELSVRSNISINQAVKLSTNELEEIECQCDTENCNGNRMVCSTVPASAPTYLLLRTEIFYPYAPWNKKKIQKNFPQFSETVDFQTKGGVVSYKLHGVVVHSGKNRDEGHYLSFIRIGKAWLKYSDDMLVTKTYASLSEDEAVYLSFYVKS